MYKTTLNNIDIKLKELKVLFHKKKAIEHKHKDQLDLDEKELAIKVTFVKQKARSILNTYFKINNNVNAIN